jgi:hypothetical protein
MGVCVGGSVSSGIVNGEAFFEIRSAAVVEILRM